MEKNVAKIPVLDLLSLSNHADDEGSHVDAHDESYELRGLVRHEGDSPLLGHYTAYVKRPWEANGAGQDEDWIHFNDANGRRSELIYVNGEQNQRNMYMALYQRAKRAESRVSGVRIEPLVVHRRLLTCPSE